jgi:hypothetical protein
MIFVAEKHCNSDKFGGVQQAVTSDSVHRPQAQVGP